MERYRDQETCLFPSFFPLLLLALLPCPPLLLLNIVLR
jgi:hypothetical protein